MTHSAGYVMGLVLVIVLCVCCTVSFAIGVACGRWWRDSRRSTHEPADIGPALRRSAR